MQWLALVLSDWAQSRSSGEGELGFGQKESRRWYRRVTEGCSRPVAARGFTGRYASTYLGTLGGVVRICVVPRVVARGVVEGGGHRYALRLDLL